VSFDLPCADLLQQAVHVELTVMFDEYAVVERVDMNNADRDSGPCWRPFAEMSGVSADEPTPCDKSPTVDEAVLDDVTTVRKSSVERLLASTPLPQAHRRYTADLHHEFRGNQFD
jgi:hypothetical protein